MAQTAHRTEDAFSAAEEAAALASAYAATAERDAEDQREYRLIPAKTPCTLMVKEVAYAAPEGNRAAALLVKVDVVEPEEYADGSSNFTARCSLNTKLGRNEDGTEKKRNGFDMTANTLSWIYASAYQVPSSEAKQVMIRDVIAEFPNISPEDVPNFHAALVENANQLLKGRTFRTKGIGVQKGGADPKTGRTYPDRQDFGTFDYPKGEKK